MARVLTVDDSRAIRMLVSKQLQDMGFEVDEAEDGEKGLAKLEEIYFDLVLLDVTMPVLDGPGMLAKMRELGNKTPVLMLTSESKKSIVAGVMKLGIEDYILKPFKPEDLRAKVQKILSIKPGDTGAALPASAVAAACEPPRQEAAAGVRSFIDILVVDDMENVHRKLRTMLPEHLSLNNAGGAQAAISICRERVFRIVLLDLEMPDVNSIVLMGQLRILQPHAAFMAMGLRTIAGAEASAREHGFDGVLLKPFFEEDVQEFMARYFENQEIVATQDNVVSVAAFTGREERVDRYFQQLGKLIPAAVETIAAACHDEMVLDLTQLPARPSLTPRFVIEVDAHAKRMGLGMKLVCPAAVHELLKEFTESANIPFFASLEAARSAVAQPV